MNRQQRREQVRQIVNGYEREGALLEEWLRNVAADEDVEAMAAATRFAEHPTSQEDFDAIHGRAEEPRRKWLSWRMGRSLN